MRISYTKTAAGFEVDLLATDFEGRRFGDISP